MSDKMVTIKGLAWWAFTKEVNKESGDFSIDICHLDDATVKMLEEKKIKFNHDPEEGGRGYYITCKSKPSFPPKVKDKFKQDFNEKIGNGSEVVLRGAVFEWAEKFKKKAMDKGEGYKSVGIRGIVVLDHVAFEDNWMYDYIEEPTAEQVASQAFDDGVEEYS